MSVDITKASVRAEILLGYSNTARLPLIYEEAVAAADVSARAVLRSADQQLHIIDNFPAAQVNGVPWLDLAGEAVYFARVGLLIVKIGRSDRTIDAAGSAVLQVTDLFGNILRQTVVYHAQRHFFEFTPSVVLPTSELRITFSPGSNLAAEVCLIGFSEDPNLSYGYGS